MHNYLEAGITALANTKLKYNYPWFFAHAGAAVLSGAFMLQSSTLSASTQRAIASSLDRMINSDPELYVPAAENDARVEKDDLLQALQQCTLTHSTTGHGVIFGTLALKAALLEPALFTQSVSRGLVQLLEDCLIDVPNRHLGIENYRSSSVDYSGAKTFNSTREAANYSLSVHTRVYPDQSIDDTFYFLAGNLLHCVTYAHALLELDNLGYSKLANSGLDVLAQHMFLSAREHPALHTFSASAVLNPEDESFWERKVNEPHQLKLAYSALAIAASYTTEEKKTVFKDLSKYWEMFSR
ncbi:MAG: hypothetical protein AAF542_08875 [Pseudomonadota bacterium]